MDEFALIERVLAPLAVHDGARALADDGAVIAPGPGMRLAVTKDMMAEGVHFLADDPPERLARRLLRTNLSDLAAMGANPVGYLLGLASDARRDEAWCRAFARGLARDQAAFGLSLLGGDTIAAPGGLLTLSLTAIGEVSAETSMTRDGARAGDLVAVSGTIGDAALGLLSRQRGLAGVTDSQRRMLEARHDLPEPRLALARAIAPLAHAAIDISDGLLADAGHIARRSRLAVGIRVTDVPLSDAARAAVGHAPGLLGAILGGEIGRASCRERV